MKWRQLPLGIVGAAALGAGLWGGLIRIGWSWSVPSPAWIAWHGPLMVCGFLGTLIGLERAVALGKRWGYAAPIFSALGAAALLLSARAAPFLFSAASLAFLAVTTAFLQRQRADFLVAGMLGAAAWVAGNLRWALDGTIVEAVPSWMAFLVLTIAAERLELSRLVQHSRFAHRAFGGITLVWFVVAVLPLAAAEPVCAIALGATAVWLWRYDIARWTVRSHGLARYAALALLGGYAWLAVAAAGLIAAAPGMVGLHYDAILHAVFVGFVFSMIFAHAPIILPAVLGVQVDYHAALSVPLVVLHSGVILRLLGDWLPQAALRRWGGLTSAIAIVLYVAIAGASRLRATSKRMPPTA